MIQEVTITRISATDKRKDGTPLEGKWGAYYRIGLQVEEYPDEWLNGFSSKSPTWDVGDKVTLLITETEWQGQPQKNFRIPKEEDVLKAKVAELEETAVKEAEPSAEKKEADDEPF